MNYLIQRLADAADMETGAFVRGLITFFGELVVAAPTILVLLLGLTSLIGRPFRERTIGRLVHIAVGVGLAAAVVCNGQDAWHSAQQGAGGAIQPLARSPSDDIVKGFPLHLPQRPIAVTLSAPDLGQHTEEVLRDILGLSPSEIAQLAQDNVIGTRPASPNASRLD